MSGEEHALVNERLYLPDDWARNRGRRRKCHVPRAVRFQTRHALSLEMLDEVGGLLPHAWVAGDDEMGRSSVFRRDLRDRRERYLLAVPSNTLVRDLEAEPPAYAGRGAPAKAPFQRVERWRAALPQDAWTPLEVRDGEKGPLTIELAKCRVLAKSDRGGVGPEELLVVIRARDEQGTLGHDYYLSNASAETELQELARVSKAAHRIEECLKRGKSEAGLGDYETRSWPGWHHHQTLSLIAAWFLILEARRGKKIDAGTDGPASPRGPGSVAPRRLSVRWTHAHRPRAHTAARAQSTRPLLPLQTTQTLGPLGFGTTADLEQ